MDTTTLLAVIVMASVVVVALLFLWQRGRFGRSGLSADRAIESAHSTDPKAFPPA